MVARDIIDMSLPVKPLSEAEKLVKKTRDAIFQLHEMGGGVMTYNNIRGVRSLDKPHATLTTVPSNIYVYNDGWRMATTAEYRRVMSLPDCHFLDGNQRQQSIQCGNGVDVAVAREIVRQLLKNQ